MTSAERELQQIKEILSRAPTRTIAIDKIYAIYPQLDNTNATKRLREMRENGEPR